MDGFDAYRFFKVIQLHFKQKSYDIVKYGYSNKRFGMDAYMKNASGVQYHYEKLATRFDDATTLQRYIASQFFYQTTLHITAISDPKQDDCAAKWGLFTKYNNAKEYWFKEDLDKLNLPEDLKPIGDNIPKLMMSVSKGVISPYTPIMINMYCNRKYFDALDYVLGADHIIWSDYANRFRKMQMFIPPVSDTKYNSLRDTLTEAIKSSKHTQTHT